MLLQTTGNSLVVETFATIHSHARIGRSFIPQAGQIAASAKSQADHEDIMNAVKSCDSATIAAALRKQPGICIKKPARMWYRLGGHNGDDVAIN